MDSENSTVPRCASRDLRIGMSTWPGVVTRSLQVRRSSVEDGPLTFVSGEPGRQGVSSITSVLLTSFTSGHPIWLRLSSSH